MADKRILGLLQNQWAHNPQRVQATLDRIPGQRRKLIAYMLFRSHSGRRLKKVFGSLTDRIEWENVSPIISNHSSACPAADIEHVRAVIRDVQPDIVLAFGRVAENVAWRAFFQSAWPGPLIVGPHPAARHGDIRQRLAKMHEQLNVLLADPQPGPVVET